MAAYVAPRFSGILIISLLFVYGSLPVLSSRFMPEESWSSSFSRKLTAASGSTIGGGADQLGRTLQSLRRGEQESEVEEAEVVLPAVFQMLPKNSKPPPRGPSPGSNVVGAP